MAQNYNVEVTEVLQRNVEIEADSYEEAEDKVSEQYYNCDIILDADDLVEQTIGKRVSDVICDKDELFNITVNGIKLEMSDITAIHSYYEACCTAEQIIEKTGVEVDKAISMGYDVRERFNDLDYAGEMEDQIIQEVIDEQSEKTEEKEEIER